MLLLLSNPIVVIIKMALLKFNKELFLKDISENRSTIMGLSIIAIILFHQDYITGFPLSVFQYYGYWGVDVFLLLSGMGLVNSLRKYPVRTYYRRRLLRLFPACLLCGIMKCTIILLLSILSLLPYDTVPINWLSPFSMDLWFIRAIIIYYLISPFLNILLQKNTWLTITIIACLYLTNELFFRVHDSNSPSWIIERLPIFSIGMLLMIKKNILNSRNLVLSFFFFLIAVVTVYIYKGDIYSTVPWAIMMGALTLGTTSMVYSITNIVKRLPLNLLLPFKWIGNLSLELYLVHEFIMNTIPFFIVIETHRTGALLFSIALSFLVALSCKWIINKTITFFRMQKSC